MKIFKRIAAVLLVVSSPVIAEPSEEEWRRLATQLAEVSTLQMEVVVTGAPNNWFGQGTQLAHYSEPIHLFSLYFDSRKRRLIVDNELRTSRWVVTQKKGTYSSMLGLQDMSAKHIGLIGRLIDDLKSGFKECKRKFPDSLTDKNGVAQLDARSGMIQLNCRAFNPVGGALQIYWARNQKNIPILTSLKFDVGSAKVHIAFPMVDINGALPSHIESTTYPTGGKVQKKQ